MSSWIFDEPPVPGASVSKSTKRQQDNCRIAKGAHGKQAQTGGGKKRKQVGKGYTTPASPGVSQPSLNNPEDLEAWIAARKARWPSAANMEKNPTTKPEPRLDQPLKAMSHDCIVCPAATESTATQLPATHKAVIESTSSDNSEMPAKASHLDVALAALSDGEVSDEAADAEPFAPSVPQELEAELPSAAAQSAAGHDTKRRLAGLNSYGDKHKWRKRKSLYERLTEHEAADDGA